MLPEGMIQAGAEGKALAQQAKAQELIRFQQKMNDLTDRLEQGPTQEEELRKACVDFEAVFMGKIWQEMQSTVPKEGYLHGKTDDMYLSIFEQPFSEHLAQSGGIGLADMLYDQLAAKLKSSSTGDLPGKLNDRSHIKPLAESGKAEIKPLAESLGTVNTKLKEPDVQVEAEPAAKAETGPKAKAEPAPQAVDHGKRVDELSQTEVDVRLAALAEDLAKDVAEELVQSPVDEETMAEQLLAEASEPGVYDPSRAWDRAVVGREPESEPELEVAAVDSKPAPEPVAQAEPEPDKAQQPDTGWVSAEDLLSGP